MPQNAEETIYCVALNTAGAGNKSPLNTSGAGAVARFGTTTAQDVPRTVGASSTAAIWGSTVTGTWQVYRFRFQNGSPDTAGVRVGNGTEIVNSATFTYTPAGNYTALCTMVGSLACVACIDRYNITTDEDTEIMAYLSAKFGAANIGL